MAFGDSADRRRWDDLIGHKAFPAKDKPAPAAKKPFPARAMRTDWTPATTEEGEKK